MSTFAPCHGCPRRAVRCHGRCPDYAAAKADMDARREQEQQGKVHLVDEVAFRKKKDARQNEKRRAQG